MKAPTKVSVTLRISWIEPARVDSAEVAHLNRNLQLLIQNGFTQCIERLVGLLTQVAAPTKAQQMPVKAGTAAAAVGSRNLS